MRLLAGAPDSGFARALAPRPFDFPTDHGPHPDFRTEWWYVTANLRTDEGREFGVQFTIFRSALAPPPVAGVDGANASPWDTRQAYMAHFAVTDVATERFHAFERFARGAVDIAGATVDPGFRVWVDDWELATEGPTMAGAEGIFPLRLRAADTSAAVALDLRRGRPLVLQGEAGLSRKGAGPGEASYYLTFPRMEVEGTVRLAGAEHPVRGMAWMDREWSTSVLSEDQEGWDWFALHLPDGRDLMLFELRSRSGAPVVEGTLIDPDGTARRVSPAEVTLEVRDHWESPLDRTRYPSHWRISIPSFAVDVEVVPLVANQEFAKAFRYWEGAVRVRGSGGSEGRGYVELTGYAGTGPAR